MKLFLYKWKNFLNEFHRLSNRKIYLIYNLYFIFSFYKSFGRSEESWRIFVQCRKQSRENSCRSQCKNQEDGWGKCESKMYFIYSKWHFLINDSIDLHFKKSVLVLDVKMRLEFHPASIIYLQYINVLCTLILIKAMETFF